jgi:hypothetical protein
MAGAIALTLTVVLPLTAASGPASPSARPIPLVSITLSPTTPASTDVLAAVARLLGQRAAYLHLPDTQAQVLGPDVVLTGPVADETQLKAIATAGVLNFRQVLLYQPYSGTTYGDASLVNRHTLALFRKLACTPGNTSTWKDQVGYTAAGDYDNPDTQIISCLWISGSALSGPSPHQPPARRRPVRGRPEGLACAAVGVRSVRGQLSLAESRHR